MNISGTEWLLILAVALLLFGAKRLPALGAAVGRTIREFRRSAQGIFEEEPSAQATPTPQRQTATPSDTQPVPPIVAPSASKDDK